MREKKNSQMTKVLNSPLHVPWFFIPPVEGKLRREGTFLFAVSSVLIMVPGT